MNTDDPQYSSAVRDTEIVSAVVRTLDTVITITLTPATYNAAGRPKCDK